MPIWIVEDSIKVLYCVKPLFWLLFQLFYSILYCFPLLVYVWYNIRFPSTMASTPLLPRHAMPCHVWPFLTLPFHSLNYPLCPSHLFGSLSISARPFHLISYLQIWPNLIWSDLIWSLLLPISFLHLSSLLISSDLVWSLWISSPLMSSLLFTRIWSLVLHHPARKDLRPGSWVRILGQYVDAVSWQVSAAMITMTDWRR